MLLVYLIILVCWDFGITERRETPLRSFTKGNCSIALSEKDALKCHLRGNIKLFIKTYVGYTPEYLTEPKKHKKSRYLPSTQRTGRALEDADTNHFSSFEEANTIQEMQLGDKPCIYRYRPTPQDQYKRKTYGKFSLQAIRAPQELFGFDKKCVYRNRPTSQSTEEKKSIEEIYSGDKPRPCVYRYRPRPQLVENENLNEKIQRSKRNCTYRNRPGRSMENQNLDRNLMPDKFCIYRNRPGNSMEIQNLAQNLMPDIICKYRNRPLPIPQNLDTSVLLQLQNVIKRSKLPSLINHKRVHDRNFLDLFQNVRNVTEQQAEFLTIIFQYLQPDVMVEWLTNLHLATKSINKNLFVFMKEWTNVLLIPPIYLKEKLNGSPSMLPLEISLDVMSTTDDFLKLFWPFRHDVAKMNQKLALYGLTKIKSNRTKPLFYKAFASIQRQDLPIDKNKIVYSFNHSRLVEELNRTKLALFKKEFVNMGKHLFTEEERQNITRYTNKALALINETAPFLYKSIVQLVSAFAFYKTEDRSYSAGSTRSLLGVIWLNPSAGRKWTIPMYAEMIIHEFIHTHLFYAELVHGCFSDPVTVSDTKVFSVARTVPRDYDKSFHAAYVNTGVAVFHARAGYLSRAKQLTYQIRRGVDTLIKANKEKNLLDKSGKAMLQFLDDFLDMARIQRH